MAIFGLFLFIWLVSTFVFLFLLYRFIRLCDDVRFLAEVFKDEHQLTPYRETPVFPFVMVAVIVFILLLLFALFALSASPTETVLGGLLGVQLVS